ncbi:MAG: hypothetical protein KDN19_04370 [Verrucomicrobiae bacterium]|nr:hypothetical protein [Verrucomicrobiae bacterium]
MTTTTTPQSKVATISLTDASVAQRLHAAAESLADLVSELALISEHSERWYRLKDFLDEMQAGADKKEVTPEELTGWAVALTFAAVEARIHAVEPNVFFLVRSYGEACLLAAHCREEQDAGRDTEESLSQFNAAIDFILDGVPEIEIPQATIWKKAA